MRSISETLSLMIVSSVAIFTALAIFYATLYFNDITNASLEYGRMKFIFKDLAVKLDELVSGYTFTYTYPSTMIGVGFRILDYSVTFSITFINGTTTDLSIGNFYSLRAELSKIVISTQSIVYGETSSVLVTKLDEIPVIREYVENGKTVLELSLNKIKYSIYKLETINTSEYVIEVYIIRINKPEIVGNKMIKVYAIPNTELTKTYANVSSLEIIVNNEVIATSDQLFSSVGLNPQDIEYFTLQLRVIEVFISVY
ncbi:MAG: hypothetical protein ABWW65_04205 [Thermoprotei archaeon]